MPTALIDYRPAVAGQQPVFKRQRISGVFPPAEKAEIVAIYAPVNSVKRADSALEVTRRLHPRFPNHILAVHAERNTEIVDREFPIAGICERDRIRAYLRFVPVSSDLECRHVKISVYNGKRGPVLELSVFRPFHSYQPVGQYSKTCVSAFHDSIVRRFRILSIRCPAEQKRCYDNQCFLHCIIVLSKDKGKLKYTNMSHF